MASFAGGLADGFNSVFLARKEQERKDKIAKLQGQLVELQLKQLQDRESALGKLDRAADIPRLTDVDETGLGEFQKRSLSELLVEGQNPELEAAAFRAGIVDPGTILQERRLADQQALNQELFNQFSGDVGGGLVPSGAQVSPGRPPVFSFERDPSALTPGQGGDALLRLQSILDSAKTVATEGPKLEGSGLELGQPFRSFGRTVTRGLGFVKNLFGSGGEQEEQLANAADKVGKAIADLQINNPAFTSATTDVARRAALSASPEDAKTLAANLSVIDGTIDRELDRLRQQGVEIPPELLQEAQQVKQLLNSLKPYSVDDIRGLSREEIFALPEEVLKSLPTEHRKALSDRVDELSGNP